MGLKWNGAHLPVSARNALCVSNRSVDAFTLKQTDSENVLLYNNANGASLTLISLTANICLSFQNYYNYIYLMWRL